MSDALWKTAGEAVSALFSVKREESVRRRLEAVERGHERGKRLCFFCVKPGKLVHLHLRANRYEWVCAGCAWIIVREVDGGAADPVFGERRDHVPSEGRMFFLPTGRRMVPMRTTRIDHSRRLV